MKKYFILLFLVVCITTNISALTKEQRMEIRHSFSIGYGDQFRDLLGHKFISIGNIFSKKEYYDKKITGNIFGEYMFQATKVLSVGLNVNYNGWRSMVDEYSLNENDTIPKTYRTTIHTIGLLPTLNFTYFGNETVNLYSGFGIGAMVIFEDDWVGAMPAIDLCLFGVSFGNEHWFGSAEVGCLFSSILLAYTVPTRIVSMSVGYRF